MSGEKFLKEWQFTDKIIEWIFFQLTLNLLRMTQTQEIINHRVSKIHKWVWGDVYEWKKVFLMTDKFTDKIIEWIFF